MRRTPYQRIILEVDPTVDAVGVEASMRLHYGTLDHLSRDEFKREIAIAKGVRGGRARVLEALRRELRVDRHTVELTTTGGGRGTPKTPA